MIGKRILFGLTVVVLILAILQMTPLAFRNEEAADFVWGAACGLVFASIVVWFSERNQ